MTKLRTVAIAAALAFTVSTSAFADLQLSTNYSPSPAVQALAETAASWMELYHVTPAELPDALSSLVTRSVVPPAVGVAFAEALHLQVNMRDLELTESSFEMTRNGAPVGYDEACTVLPQARDNLDAEYRDNQSGIVASLKLEILEHYAFKPEALVGQAETMTRVLLSTGDGCDEVTESRLLLKGTLTVTETTETPVIVPVLVQAIYLK